MFSLFITNHTKCLLAIATCFVMSSAEADVIDDTRIKIYEGMLTIGKHVQLARECGVLDSQMPGYFASYQSYLKVHEAAYNNSKLAVLHKAKLGPVSNVKAQFVQGTQQVIRGRQRISAQHCNQLKLQWAASDAMMAEHAKKNFKLAHDLK